MGNDPVNMVDPTGLRGEDACQFKLYCALISNDKIEVRTHEEQGPFVSSKIYPSDAPPDECELECVTENPPDDFGDDTEDFFNEDSSNEDNSTDNTSDESNSDESNSDEDNLAPEIPELPEKDKLLSS